MVVGALRGCYGAPDLACGNGADRTIHPAEMLGDDEYEHGDWGLAPAPPRTDGPSTA
ncbi:DUF3079 domain-containing protein [Pseudomonas canadensis]|uniref:DUF3079 domain-containing protein n=1 Tax=Pseudomonas canadensis TaxID=915099 RepID=UPI0030CC766E